MLLGAQKARQASLALTDARRHESFSLGELWTSPPVDTRLVGILVCLETV